MSGTVPHGWRTLPFWTTTRSEDSSPPAMILTVVSPALYGQKIPECRRQPGSRIGSPAAFCSTAREAARGCVALDESPHVFFRGGELVFGQHRRLAGNADADRGNRDVLVFRAGRHLAERGPAAGARSPGEPIEEGRPAARQQRAIGRFERQFTNHRDQPHLDLRFVVRFAVGEVDFAEQDALRAVEVGFCPPCRLPRSRACPSRTPAAPWCLRRQCGDVACHVFFRGVVEVGRGGVVARIAAVGIFADQRCNSLIAASSCAAICGAEIAVGDGDRGLARPAGLPATAPPATPAELRRHPLCGVVEHDHPHPVVEQGVVGRLAADRRSTPRPASAGSAAPGRPKGTGNR